MDSRDRSAPWLAAFALIVCLPLLFWMLQAITSPAYQSGFTDRYTAQQQRRTVEAQEWGETLRVWGAQAGETGRVAAVAGGAAAVVGLAAWGVIRWQEERTKRTGIVEQHTTQRHMISAQRDVVLAYIAQYGGRAGELDGVRGVFLDAAGEFVPADVCRAELAAARRLTG